jgi:hypothetical protein
LFNLLESLTITRRGSRLKPLKRTRWAYSLEFKGRMWPLCAAVSASLIIPFVG